MKRVFLETYGCQMNVADSELMAGVLERAGFTLTGRPEDADAIVLNTCAIREHAEQRVLGRLGDFARLQAARPGLVGGVAGASARRGGARLGHDPARLRQVLNLLRCALHPRPRAQLAARRPGAPGAGGR